MSKLKQRRRDLHWTLKDVAERLQMTQQNVSQQEQRGIQTIRTALRYADVLHCSPYDLIELNISSLQSKKQ